MYKVQKWREEIKQKNIFFISTDNGVSDILRNLEWKFFYKRPIFRFQLTFFLYLSVVFVMILNLRITSLYNASSWHYPPVTWPYCNFQQWLTVVDFLKF